MELIFANFDSHSEKYTIEKVSSIKVNGTVKEEIKSYSNILQRIDFPIDSWVSFFHVISEILADGILDCFLQ